MPDPRSRRRRTQTWAALLIAAQVTACHQGSSPSARRLFFNSVNAGSAELLFQPDFERYVDAMRAAGIQNLHVLGQLRERCFQCAPGGPIDINLEPALGIYDFSVYFQRLDYAVQRGMGIILSINFAGRMDGDPASRGSYDALPAFFGVDDVMLQRDASGRDQIYAGTPPASGMTKVPRFEKPAVRAALLDFVTAAVTQFRARYGDAIRDFGFTFNTTSESEYPLGPGLTDTSPDAARAFDAWLATRYPTPPAVSAAWGRQPAFTDFAQIPILDGRPPPLVGQAPQAYLDFAAYREAALASFQHDIRDRIHAAGGKALAQLGSVWDALSAKRGTFGFGRQIDGFDLVVIDDAPEYDHLFSMDYTRTNSPGVPFGNEADAPCTLGCSSGNTAACCDSQTFPAGIDVAFGKMRLEAQVAQSYARGAVYVDLANWDNFYSSAFTAFATSLSAAESLSLQAPTMPATTAVQPLSLKQLYVHHDDNAYIRQLISDHAALGGANAPIAVTLAYDL